MSNISWTGRGKGTEKKIPLKNFPRITAFISDMCKIADKNFSQEDCIRLIKYKILKYAYKQADPTDEQILVSTKSNCDQDSKMSNTSEAILTHRASSIGYTNTQPVILDSNDVMFESPYMFDSSQLSFELPYAFNSASGLQYFH